MSVCPVCNALVSFSYICSNCSSLLEDKGRLSDYYSDYSPYREYDDISMTNGYMDVQQDQCVHVGYCTECRHEERIIIQQQQ